MKSFLNSIRYIPTHSQKVQTKTLHTNFSFINNLKPAIDYKLNILICTVLIKICLRIIYDEEEDVNHFWREREE